MLKRWFDVGVVMVAAPLWAPVLAVVAAISRIIHGSPVLFRQSRGGYRGKPFELLKLRTMTNARNAAGELLPDEVRLTRFGRFLRETSLDELPALLNVLRGDMSLVGPRPFMSQYLALYTGEQARRHDVLPGITGWAQVNGRNALSWEEKFALDLWYVDHQSFLLDLRILIMTVLRVVRRDGVAQPGKATAEVFRGTQPRA